MSRGFDVAHSLQIGGDDMRAEAEQYHQTLKSNGFKGLTLKQVPQTAPNLLTIVTLHLNVTSSCITVAKISDLLSSLHFSLLCVPVCPPLKVCAACCSLRKHIKFFEESHFLKTGKLPTIEDMGNIGTLSTQYRDLKAAARAHSLTKIQVISILQSFTWDLRLGMS